MIITTPGVYEISNDAYHEDPAETPSLSAGMISQLLSAPAKCYEASKRLNPEWEEPEKQDKFTIGTVSHIMFLEPHLFEAKVMVCPYADWRSKDAKDAKATARRIGMTPILTHQMEMIKKARDAFYRNTFVSGAFKGGKFEQSLFWRHPTYGFWCRARPDFLHDSLSHICDYKATANADPTEFGKHAYNMGYHRRAAWYLDGAKEIFGKEPEHYWFVNQETKAPFLPAAVKLKMNAIEAGRAENDRAAYIFNECLKSGEWYGYRHPSEPTRDLAFQADLPAWAYMKLNDGE